MKRLMVIFLFCLISSSVYAADLNITITIPDVIRQETVNAFANTYKYQDTINGQPNPETKVQFTKRIVREFVREVYKSHKVTAGLNRDALIIQSDSETSGVNVQ